MPVPVLAMLSALFLFSSGAHAQALNDGLVSYYRENARDAHTDSTGANHGTVAAGAPTFVTGKLGGAYEFVGRESESDPRVSATVSVQGWTAGTVSTWILATNYSSGNLLTVWQFPQVNNWGHLWLSINSATRKINFHIGNGQNDATDTTSTTSIEDNTWYHVTAVWNRTTNTSHLYVNGKQESTKNVTGWGQPRNQFYWGAGFNGYGMRGIIDEIGIWNRALTSSEITSLYNNGIGTTFPFSSSPMCNPPRITIQPRSERIPQGQTGTLMVTATGTERLTYQWHQGPSGDTSRPIGTDAATFTTPTLANTAYYWVRVTNACGAMDSNTSTVSTPLQFTSSATLAPAISGTPYTHTFAATGGRHTEYLWALVVISGGRLPGLSFDNQTGVLKGTPTQAGIFRFGIQVNSDGETLTRQYDFTITGACLAPSIVTQPQNQSIMVGQNAAVTAAATGTAPLNYQWYQGNAGDTSRPVGANASTYTITGSATSVNYWVKISNACGTISSTAAQITVQVPIPTSGATITKVAGGYTSHADGVSGLLTSLSARGLAVDAAGNIYIAAMDEHRIRKLDRAGIITTVAGNGTPGTGTTAAGPALAWPTRVALDATGNLYVTEQFTKTVRKIARSGEITTVAGGGTGGDGGAASDAALGEVKGLALDKDGNLYIAAGCVVRKVSTSGTISTVAFGGTSVADNIPAKTAQGCATSISVDTSGNLYVADGVYARIRKVDSTGTIRTIAGNDQLGFAGDGGPAVRASISPILYGMALGTDGSIFFNDGDNHRIRKVDANGNIFTVVGNGNRGETGDDGPALEASLSYPTSLVLDPDGNLFVSHNDSIRKVTFGAPARVPTIESFQPLSVAPGGQLVIQGRGFVEESVISPTGRNSVSLTVGDVQTQLLPVGISSTSLKALVPPILLTANGEWYQGPATICVTVDDHQRCAATPVFISAPVRPAKPNGDTLLDLVRKYQGLAKTALVSAGASAFQSDAASAASFSEFESLVRDAVAGRPQMVPVEMEDGTTQLVAFDVRAIQTIESLIAANQNEPSSLFANDALSKLATTRSAAPECFFPRESLRLAAKSEYDKLTAASWVIFGVSAAAGVAGAVTACGATAGSGCPLALALAGLAVKTVMTYATWDIFAAQIAIRRYNQNLLQDIKVPADILSISVDANEPVILKGMFVNMSKSDVEREIVGKALPDLLTGGLGQLVPKKVWNKVGRPLTDSMLKGIWKLWGPKIDEIFFHSEDSNPGEEVELSGRVLKATGSSPYAKLVLACSSDSADRNFVIGMMPTGGLPDEIGLSVGDAVLLLQHQKPLLGRLYVDVRDSPAVELSTVDLSPRSVTSGQSVFGTVDLNAPAPQAGARVVLSSNNTILSIPNEVIVRAGERSARFNASTKSVATRQIVTLTAAYGTSSRSTTLTVDPAPVSLPPAISVQGFSIQPLQTTGGNGVTGRIMLTAVAPTGGARVALSSTNIAAPVPSTVIVPAGQNFVEFTIRTTAVSTQQLADISVTFQNTTLHATLTINPGATTSPSLPALLIDDFTLSTNPVRGGGTVTGSIRLNVRWPSTAESRLPILVLSSDQIIAAAPPVVFIDQGQNSAQFLVRTQRVASERRVIFQVKLSLEDGNSKFVTLTITP